MFSKSIAHVLVSALFLSFVGVPSIPAKTKEEKAAEFAAKVKREIAKLGTGTETRIVVKLRDKRTIAGYISAIHDESFAITDAKTGVSTTVSYPAVAAVKGRNKALWITLGVVGVAVLVLWLALIRPYCNNEGC